MDLSCVGAGTGAAARSGVCGGPRSGPVGRRAVLAAVGAVLVLVLAGCGGATPEPTQTFAEYTPPSTPTPSPTPTPTTDAAPAQPPEMERTDEVGAAAAATYFMELFAYVYRSGDLREWKTVSDEGCAFCASVRDDVASVYEIGGRFEGGRIALESAEVLGQDPVLGVYAVRVPYVVEPANELDRHGAVTDAVERETGRARLEVIHALSGWTLLGGRSDDEGDT